MGFSERCLDMISYLNWRVFFAVPAEAPEVTEGAFAFRDDHKAILYWKVRTKYPPFLAKKNPVIFVEVLAAPFSLSEE